MNVTHNSEFRKLKYVHVTGDTFSGFIHATPQTGENGTAVIPHCLTCFTVLGLPRIIKTDNGTGYTERQFQNFYKSFNIIHKTNIPYNPQGQGIVERAHATLKQQLEKIKKGELYPQTPHNYLQHALFILNFLNLDVQGRSAAQRFWQPEGIKGRPMVRWKDPLTGQWHGPDPVLIWGRGYACVFPQDAEGPRWLPERLVRTAITLLGEENEEADLG